MADAAPDPSQRVMAGEAMQQLRQRWQDISPEQRQQMREQMLKQGGNQGN